jgi:hypothetical protein
VACMVTYDEGVCLAVLQILGFSRGTRKSGERSISWMLLDDLDNAQSNIIAHTQVAELTQVSEHPHKWFFTGHYLQTSADGSNKTNARQTRRQYVLEVSGRLITPLWPQIEPMPLSDVHHQTRTLNHSILDMVQQALWSTLSPPVGDLSSLVGNIAILPDLLKTDTIPYRDLHGIFPCVNMSWPTNNIQTDHVSYCVKDLPAPI